MSLTYPQNSPHNLIKSMASILSILLLILSLSNLHFTLPTGNNHITDRKSLEIIIGGGNDGNPPPSSSPEPEPEPEDCPPPPPPPPCPPPPLLPPCPPPPQLPPSEPPHSPPSPSPPKLPPKHRPPPSPPTPDLKFASPLLEKVYPVLQRFKDLVEDDPYCKLDSWNGSDICNKYNGLKCAIFPNTNYLALASIQFNGFKLGGKNLRLDNFLDKLEEVSIFHANSNNFLGSVPDVSKLKYLFELDLSNNKLTGDFPTNVLKGKNLTFLDLRFNTFSGCVPPQVFKLDLDVLFINNNNLVQELPRNLGSITALYLTFANNRLGFSNSFRYKNINHGTSRGHIYFLVCFCAYLQLIECM